MKEYLSEYNRKVKLDNLKAPKMSLEEYKLAHKNLVISCHDVLIEYRGGILLVIRNMLPAINTPWPIGGRIERGIPTEESLKMKVKEECNLELYDIKFLGCARQFFETDPFGHGKGTDSMALMYFGKGIGELKLNSLHKNPRIITTKDYTAEFRKKLHPYVRDFMDLVMKK
jgi:hypothetical protein